MIYENLSVYLFFSVYVIHHIFDHVIFILLLLYFFILFFLFFSSRRRHTRYWRDWSSDVCSSDLCGTSPPASGPLVEPDVGRGTADAALLDGGSPRRRLVEAVGRTIGGAAGWRPGS